MPPACPTCSSSASRGPPPRTHAFTARILEPLGARTVWLVTQPFHGRRAALLFRRAGLEPRVWHIADSLQYRDRRRGLRWIAREYGAWGMLALRTLTGAARR